MYTVYSMVFKPSPRNWPIQKANGFGENHLRGIRAINQQTGSSPEMVLNENFHIPTKSGRNMYAYLFIRQLGQNLSIFRLRVLTFGSIFFSKYG